MMLAVIDVIGGDIPQSFVITPVVIVFDKASNCFPQLTRHLMGQLIELTFESAMVSLNLAIGLRMEGRGGNVPYPHESQVFIELVGNGTAISGVATWDS